MNHSEELGLSEREKERVGHSFDQTWTCFGEA